MITATMTDKEIEVEVRGLRHAIHLDHLSPIQQIQMDCLGYPDNLIYGLMLGLLMHEIYDSYQVVQDGEIVYDGRIELDAIPKTFIDPCETCREKLDRLEREDGRHKV